MPRRTPSFLTLTVTWWLSLASVGWAQQDSQDGGVDGAPGPITVHAARAPQTYRLKRDYAHTPVALTIALPLITRAQQAASTGTQEPERPYPLRIGFGRDVPTAYRNDLASRLTWERQRDGTAVSALSVSSPDARAVRIALRATLPAGAEIRFFSPADREQRFPPVQPADLSAGSAAEARENAPAEEEAEPLWSPVVEGDAVGVEISLPSVSAGSDVTLFIDRVSHLPASVRQAAPGRLSEIGRAASCQIDIVCRRTTPRTLAAATAKMVYTNPTGETFLCTGTLMNDTDDSSFIPYFLTANHCIGTQTVARTLNTYWHFERADCRCSRLPDINQLSGGADLLATDSGTDATLLRLRETPPGRTWYAGWDSQPLGHPALMVGIHHPRGDLKKWNRGISIDDRSITLIETGQLVSSFAVAWREGTIEGGASGSGLFDTWGRLRGILSAVSLALHEIPCGAARQSPASFYGRFALFYPQVRRWLDPTSGSSHDGATLAQATLLQPDTEIAGDLERSGDVDFFRVEVPEAGRLTVETTGSTDTLGYLQDAQGRPLAEDDNAGSDNNFRIVRLVPAGTYHVAVTGAGGSTVDTDHGDTVEQATSVGLISTTAGTIAQSNDVDYFRVTVTEAGTLTLETSGTTDTYGSLLQATGRTLAEDDDSAVDENFQIVRRVPAGTYYVTVKGHDADSIGTYRLHVDFTAASISRRRLRSLLGTWRFTSRTLPTFTRTYRLSRVDTTTETPFISGTDEDGSPIIAGRIQDIRPGTDLSFEYALLDDGTLFCSLYLFNKTGNNAVSGDHYFFRNGDCSGIPFHPYPMTGRRISLSTLSDSAVLRPQTGAVNRKRTELRIAEARRSLKERSTSRPSGLGGGIDNSIADIVQALSRQLEKHK